MRIPKVSLLSVVEIGLLLANFWNVAFIEGSFLPNNAAEYLINLIFITFVANEMWREYRARRKRNERA